MGPQGRPQGRVSGAQGRPKSSNMSIHSELKALSIGYGSVSPIAFLMKGHCWELGSPSSFSLILLKIDEGASTMRV
jgi:hypothetical protein